MPKKPKRPCSDPGCPNLTDEMCIRDRIRYVQEIVGLAAIGKVYIEALVIAYGEGRNGKSTFWNRCV